MDFWRLSGLVCMILNFRDDGQGLVLVKLPAKLGGQVEQQILLKGILFKKFNQVGMQKLVALCFFRPKLPVLNACFCPKLF